MGTATITRGVGNDIDGTLGEYLSDSGLALKTVERAWANNAPNVSHILPEPGGAAIEYTADWLWSQAHGRDVYHLRNVDGHTEIELHSANCMYQLKGCVAFGLDYGEFAEGSLHADMPPCSCRGVTSSHTAIEQMEADMRDGDGQQVSFVLAIQ